MSILVYTGPILFAAIVGVLLNLFNTAQNTKVTTTNSTTKHIQSNIKTTESNSPVGTYTNIINIKSEEKSKINVPRTLVGTYTNTINTKPEEKSNTSVYFVFGYGSLNVENIKKDFRNVRINDEFTINPLPVILKGYVRVFNGYSQTRKCSPASLTRDSQSFVTGIVYALNSHQFARIQEREGYAKNGIVLDTPSYVMMNIDASHFKVLDQHRKHELNNIGNVIAFTKNDKRLDYSKFICPTEQYLQEVAKTIRDTRVVSRFNQKDIVIDIKHDDDGRIVTKGQATFSVNPLRKITIHCK